MDKDSKTEKERKERNKKIFVLLFIGIIVFEFIRNYLGTFLAVTIFVLVATLIFKNTAPEKFNEYTKLLGIKTKDLNKNKSSNK